MRNPCKGFFILILFLLLFGSGLGEALEVDGEKSFFGKVAGLELYDCAGGLGLVWDGVPVCYGLSLSEEEVGTLASVLEVARADAGNPFAELREGIWTLQARETGVMLHVSMRSVFSRDGSSRVRLVLDPMCDGQAFSMEPVTDLLVFRQESDISNPPRVSLETGKKEGGAYSAFGEDFRKLEIFLQRWLRERRVVSPVQTAADDAPAMETVTIAGIQADHRVFEGKRFRVVGTSCGWGSPSGAEAVWGTLVTRSDWIVEDETGAMYVTGTPMVERGMPVSLIGTVRSSPEGDSWIFEADGEKPHRRN